MRARTVLAVAGVALVAYRVRQRGWRLVEHDLLDHVIIAEPPCTGCSGPGGVYGCEVHRPKRTISDRPQA